MTSILRLLRLLFAVALPIGLGPARAEAALIQFVVPLSGANEFPAGSGDPDGSGTANLTIDNVALTVSWNITVNNIQLPIFLDHIHSGAAGVNGPVVVDFSAELVGGPIADPDLAAVLANPAGFYVNVHTNEFPAGAIRGQIAAPEPATGLLLGTGLVWFAAAIRRRTS